MTDTTKSRTKARQSKPPAGLAAKTAPPVKEGPFLTFMGEDYTLAEQTGIWPALQFARAAEAGWRSDDPRGLAAIHALLQDVIHPDDWGKFQEDMITKKVNDLEGLMNAVRLAMDTVIASMTADAVPGEVEAPGNGTSPRQKSLPAEADG